MLLRSYQDYMSRRIESIGQIRLQILPVLSEELEFGQLLLLKSGHHHCCLLLLRLRQPVLFSSFLSFPSHGLSALFRFPCSPYRPPSFAANLGRLPPQMGMDPSSMGGPEQSPWLVFELDPIKALN